MLFIADEVMTGWGRTGTLLACEQAQASPDILCLSKGLTGGAVPLAVTMASEEIFAAHYRRPTGRGCSSTRRATPPTRSPAPQPTRTLRSGARSPCWRASPISQSDRRSACGAWPRSPDCRGARTLGTIAAVDIGGEGGYLSNLAPRLLALFGEADLLLRPLGNTVYVMPPYCIADDDLDRIYATLAEASHLG